MIQRTCVDKILGLGECPPKDLKIEEEWGPEDLNLRLFFLLKDPDTQMTCKHPKSGLILDAITHIFRLFSSLLFYFPQQHRGTSCLGSETRTRYELVGYRY